MNTSFTESISTLVNEIVIVINRERDRMMKMLRMNVRSICPWERCIFPSRSKPFFVTAIMVKMNTITIPIAAIPQ